MVPFLTIILMLLGGGDSNTGHNKEAKPHGGAEDGQRDLCC